MIISYYTIYQLTTGKIISVITCSEESLPFNIPENCGSILGNYSPKEGYIKNNQFVSYPLKPNIYSTFDFENEQWVTDLAKAKLEQWKKIKDARDTAEFAGFIWDNSTFDSDTVSQARIQSSTQLAMINPNSFSVTWTLADNSLRTLSSGDMIAVGAALSSHIQNVHQIGQTLRNNINSSNTVEEILAINWPS